MIYEALSQIIVSNVSDLRMDGNPNLFINQAPYDREFCGLFRDNPTGIAIDGYISTERSGTFQFALRGKSHATLHAVMKEVMTTLNIRVATRVDVDELGTVLIKSCRPTTEPISYQLSAANLREISVNFSINYGIVE